MSLVLNFSPITFDDREISAGRLPYGADGKEVLERLRSEHWATHVFRRDGEHGILAVPVTVNTHPSMLLLPPTPHLRPGQCYLMLQAVAGKVGLT